MTVGGALRLDADAAELAHAIPEQFVVHFLPEVDLATGAITGLEALLRWQHPQRGWLWPAQFMPIAERGGFAGALGWELLRAAAAELASWRTLPAVGSVPERQLWVATSASELLDAEFVTRLAGLVATYDLAPGTLGLEVTAETLATGSRHAPELLAELRHVGVALAIDDVRSWYGSIGSLGDLPVEAVKLDRAFVRGAGADLEGDSVVSALVSLAHAHGLRVVADGVESWSEGARLCELGCDRAIGFLFSGPQNADDARLMLTHGAGWCAPQQRGPAA
jgi:EAL domain-containing protein (putative c-di-GMP-specific phosphodiesterase class I)